VVIAVSEHDADNDALTYSASTGTVKVTAAGADIVFTAPVTQTDTTVDVVVTVTDGQATASATVIVNVKVGGNSTWNATAVYNTGDRVVVNGVSYEAKYWTKGDNPEQSGPWGPWKKV